MEYIFNFTTLFVAASLFIAFKIGELFGRMKGYELGFENGAKEAIAFAAVRMADSVFKEKIEAHAEKLVASIFGYTPEQGEDNERKA